MVELDEVKIGLLARLLIHNLRNATDKDATLNILKTTEFPTIFDDIYKEKARRLVAEKTLQILKIIGICNMADYLKIILYTKLRNDFSIITNINIKFNILKTEMHRVLTNAAGNASAKRLQALGVGSYLMTHGFPDTNNNAGVLNAMRAKSDALAAEINRVHTIRVAASPASAILEVKGVCAYLIKNAITTAADLVPNGAIQIKLSVLISEINRVYNIRVAASPESAQLEAMGVSAYLINNIFPDSPFDDLNAMQAKSDILAAEINRVYNIRVATSPESAQLEAMNVGADLIKNGLPNNPVDINAMQPKSDILAVRINSEYTTGKEITTPPLFIDYYYQEFDVEAALVSIGNNLKSVSDTDKPIVGGASKKKSSLKKKPKKRRIIKSKKPKTKKTIKKK